MNKIKRVTQADKVDTEHGIYLYAALASVILPYNIHNAIKNIYIFFQKKKGKIVHTNYTCILYNVQYTCILYILMPPHDFRKVII